MKNLLIVLLLLSSFSYGQNKIIVEYENGTETDLTKIKDKNMLKALQIVNQKRFNYKLITNKQESSFKKIDQIDNNQNTDGMNITFYDSDKNLYKNFKKNHSFTFEDYNGKLFIVEDSIIIQPWVLEKDKSNFLGYDVKKAKYENNGVLYEAWYAPKLSYKNGPDEFSGLPGLILKLEITNLNSDPLEKTFFYSTKIEIDEKAKITKPTKGQLISRKDYNKMSEEQYKKYLENQQNSIDKKID